MAQGNQRASMWTRGTVTLLIVFWVAVAAGNWLADREEIQKKLGQGETEGTAQEVNIPEQRRKPWEEDVTKLQQALDEENSGALYSDNQEEQLIVATPIPEASPAAGKDSGAGSEGTASAETAQEYTVEFAVFHRDTRAMELMTQLSTKGISSHIVRAVGPDGSTLYRVLCDEKFASEDEANLKKSKFLKLGFDVTVVPM